jgi:hypothetical protein
MPVVQKPTPDPEHADSGQPVDWEKISFEKALQEVREHRSRLEKRDAERELAFGQLIIHFNTVKNELTEANEEIERLQRIAKQIKDLKDDDDARDAREAGFKRRLSALEEERLVAKTASRVEDKVGATAAVSAKGVTDEAIKEAKRRAWIERAVTTIIIPIVVVIVNQCQGIKVEPTASIPIPTVSAAGSGPFGTASK